MALELYAQNEALHVEQAKLRQSTEISGALAHALIPDRLDRVAARGDIERSNSVE